MITLLPALMVTAPLVALIVLEVLDRRRRRTR